MSTPAATATPAAPIITKPATQAHVPTLADAVKHLDDCQKYYEQTKFKIGHADNVQQVKDPRTGNVVQESMGGYNPHFALARIAAFRADITKSDKTDKPLPANFVERVLRLKMVEPTEQHIRDTEFDLYRDVK